MEIIKNPIIPYSKKNNTSDPQIVRRGSWYYHCYANAEGVFIQKCSSISEFAAAEPVKILSSPLKGAGSNWYAPELHNIDGKWYIYGSPEDEMGCHTMRVLGPCCKEEPIGVYECNKPIKGLENIWSLDGTVFEKDGQWYFVWSQGTTIWIAKMLSPSEISPERTMIISQEYDFERKNGDVIEGPAVLKFKDRIHIVYSANDSKTDDYCLGITTCKGGNVLDAASWEKTPYAVFEKTEEIFGPGHCSFLRTEESDYIVFHANLISGSGWAGRNVWIQPFSFDEKGMPVFGKPRF